MWEHFTSHKAAFYDFKRNDCMHMFLGVFQFKSSFLSLYECTCTHFFIHSSALPIISFPSSCYLFLFALSKSEALCEILSRFVCWNEDDVEDLAKNWLSYDAEIWKGKKILLEFLIRFLRWILGLILLLIFFKRFHNFLKQF